jgi:hypothetical protein
MTDGQAFRVPEAVVRRKFLLFAAVLPLSVVVTPWLGIHAPLSSRLTTATLFGMVLLGVFLLARKWVWVTLTPRGLSGRGPTWRTVEVAWAEPVDVKSTKVSTSRGVLIGRDGDAGLLRKSLHSVFIPADILVLPDFQAAVRRHAPPAHPLRAFIDATR